MTRRSCTRAFQTPWFRSKVAARFREQSLHRLYRHISVRSRLWSSTGRLCDVGLVRKPSADDALTRPDILLCVAVCYGLHENNERIPCVGVHVKTFLESRRVVSYIDRACRTSSYIPGTWYLVQHSLHMKSDEVFYGTTSVYPTPNACLVPICTDRVASLYFLQVLRHENTCYLLDHCYTQ